MEQSIAILILFYNKLDQTKDCINSFLPSGQKIYVLNNGSDETQWSNLKSTYNNHSSVILLDAGKNLGVSGGRNFLINSTKEPWLFSVDNDITIKPQNNWKDLFERLLLQLPEVRIFCPHIYNVHENAYSKQLQVIMKGNEVSIETGDYSSTNCFPGGASIIHRNIFDEYGLYDEEMFVGFEDYEFAIRAALSGKGKLTAQHINEIELIHDHRFQITNADKQAVRQRYNNELHQKSYDRLRTKHQVNFDHDWRWWTNKQIEVMTNHPFQKAVKRGIHLIKGLFK